MSNCLHHNYQKLFLSANLQVAELSELTYTSTFELKEIQFVYPTSYDIVKARVLLFRREKRPGMHPPRYLKTGDLVIKWQ